jgi:hypothetical protein
VAASLGLRLGGDIGALFELAPFFAVRFGIVHSISLLLISLRLIAIGFDPRVSRVVFTRGGPLA